MLASLQRTLLVAVLISFVDAYRAPKADVAYERQEQLTANRWHQSDDVHPVAACDCKMAQISVHGGLSCQREGDFIVGFDAQGRWVNGGGRVPLSRAQCCRFCANIDNISSAVLDAMPAAPTNSVVSVGCHASLSREGVGCEREMPATSFVSGFQYAVRLPSLLSITYYPQGPATCCSPVLMLENGDGWEIERCDCTWNDDVSCPDGHALFEYGGFRNAGNGARVPVAPVQCCRACLGRRVHRLDDCKTLNYCSHRGICVMGACECNAGWGGPDCAKPLKGKAWPMWILWLLLGISAGFSVCVWGAARHAIDELMEQRRMQREDQEAMLEPLMVQAGEVGDEDSDDEVADGDADGDERERRPTDAVEHRIRLAVEADRHVALAAAEAAAVGDSDVDDDASDGSDVASHAGAPLMDEGRRNAAAHATAGSHGGGGAQRPTARSSEDGTQVKGRANGAAVVADDETAALQIELADKFGKDGKSPLSSVMCSICYDRPVQVALVPCGHSNLCRRCSRRLEHCPYCRKPILRRQRLYLAD